MLPTQARKGFGLLLSGMLAVASGFVAPPTAVAQDKELNRIATHFGPVSTAV